MSSSGVSKDHVLIGLPRKKQSVVSIRDTAVIASALITSMLLERARSPQPWAS